MTTDLGIFLSCNDKTAEYATYLAYQIASISSVKTSLSFGYLSHISLFQGRFPNTNIEKFIKTTKFCIFNYCFLSYQAKSPTTNTLKWQCFLEYRKI
jgi:hypothetical protein